MELQFIWMSNYKSIGEKIKLLVDSRVTCMIGKNESGKSNIIDFVAKNTLLKDSPKDIYLQKNRGFPEESTSTLIFEFGLNDKERLLLDVSNKTEKIEFSYTQKNPTISGAISEYFLKDTYSNLYEELESLGNNCLNNDSVRDQFKSILLLLKNPDERISFNHFETFNKLEKIGNKIYFSEVEGYKNYLNSLSKLKEYYLKPYDLLPELFYYEETLLKDAYTLNNDFFDKDTGSDIAIENFMNVTKCSKNTFRKATTSTNMGEKQDAKENIQKAVREEIEIPFNNFYKQENVEVSISIESTTLRILIKTTGGNMQISERSNGLRWYLNLFIALRANLTKSKNVVFLMDEPGVHLHVDAQKKLLSLFSDLSKKENQVIYSTHLPTMIDARKLYQIRAIENKKGSTVIHNAVNGDKIEGNSKKETLSPLLHAIGMNLNANLGINPDRINVITEGITDAIYLNAMADYLEKSDFAFIPSVGAGNTPLLASILSGWGETYKVLLDGDEQGNTVFSTFANKYHMEDHIIKLDDLLKNVSSPTIESLITETDYNNCGIDSTSLNESSRKKIAAQTFANHVYDKEIVSEKTKENFDFLFESLKGTDIQ